jgi:hypothetical protein
LNATCGHEEKNNRQSWNESLSVLLTGHTLRVYTPMETKINVRFPGLLGLAFIILKLCKVITWSWWWVLCPFWIPITFVLALLFVILIIWVGVKLIGAVWS